MDGGEWGSAPSRASDPLGKKACGTGKAYGRSELEVRAGYSAWCGEHTLASGCVCTHTVRQVWPCLSTQWQDHGSPPTRASGLHRARSPSYASGTAMASAVSSARRVRPHALGCHMHVVACQAGAASWRCALQTLLVGICVRRRVAQCTVGASVCPVHASASGWGKPERACTRRASLRHAGWCATNLCQRVRVCDGH